MDGKDNVSTLPQVPGFIGLRVESTNASGRDLECLLYYGLLYFVELFGIVVLR